MSATLKSWYTSARPTALKDVAYGIDVSTYQQPGTIRTMAPEFAWIKASEGRTLKDDKAVSHAAEARATGTPYGFYHFSRPTSNTPEAEAANFLAAVARAGGPGQLPMALDVEVGTGDLTSWCERFFDAVREKLPNVRLAIYANSNYLINHVRPIDNVDVWVANYTAGITTPAIGRWPAWHVWQWSDKPGGMSLDVNVARRAWLAGVLLGEGSTTEDDEMTNEQAELLKRIANQTAELSTAIVGGDGVAGPEELLQRIHAMIAEAAENTVRAITANIDAAVSRALEAKEK